MNLDALAAKIRADTMYLKMLVDQQAVKPDWEGRINVRIAETIRDYAPCFKTGEERDETEARPTNDSDERTHGVEADQENL